jgi:hypothetical protein
VSNRVIGIFKSQIVDTGELKSNIAFKWWTSKRCLLGGFWYRYGGTQSRIC